MSVYNAFCGWSLPVLCLYWGRTTELTIERKIEKQEVDPWLTKYPQVSSFSHRFHNGFDSFWRNSSGACDAGYLP